MLPPGKTQPTCPSDGTEPLVYMTSRWHAHCAALNACAEWMNQAKRDSRTVCCPQRARWSLAGNGIDSHALVQLRCLHPIGGGELHRVPYTHYLLALLACHVGVVVPMPHSVHVSTCNLTFSLQRPTPQPYVCLSCKQEPHTQRGCMIRLPA